jgi:signal transduction histidine kinase
MTKTAKRNPEIIKKTDLQLALEKQRSDISGVLHDEVCSSLTALLHDLYWIERNTQNKDVKNRSSQCIQQLTTTMSSCRNILLDLNPTPEGPSLADALTCLVDNFKVRSELLVNSEIDADINQLGIEQQSVVYRSVQEALTNITKHSNASQVHVIAKIILRQMHVQVVDDGIGLPEGHVVPSFCFGLNIQKKRTEELGGHFSIQSNSNGKGTKLHLTFPLEAQLRHL